jgi:dipeptidyl-peptidase-4
MYIKKSIVLFLLAAMPAVAQQKITLQEIWGGAFSPERMDELRAMHNTNQYTVLNANYQAGTATLDVYDFATLNKVSTIVDSKRYKEFEGIDDYIFSTDEKKVMLATRSEPIFRHSFLADFYIFDLADKTPVAISDQKIQ